MTKSSRDKRKRFRQIQRKYSTSGCHVQRRKGTSVDLTTLKDHEYVAWGDGKTYHFLLTDIEPY